MSFVAAMKDYFGMLPDEKPVQFLGEIKKLTPNDRTDFTVMLSGVGYEIEGVAAAAA
jgi:hypothetical protein